MIEDNNNASVKVANLSSYVIPEFYIYELDPDGTEKYTWIEAVDCFDYFNNIYGSRKNYPHTLPDEMIPLHNTTWLCPNIPNDEYILQNDPFNFNFGTNLNFVVNLCTVVADRKGIYDPNCVSNRSEVFDYIDKARVYHKFVRQYFNPRHFMEERELDYVADNRAQSDFVKGITPTNFYIVEKNQGSFYDNKWFDWSTFTFMKADYIAYYVGRFSSYTMYTNFQQDPLYGLYSFALAQAPTIQSSEIALLSFDQTLALIGGYVGTVWGIITFLTSNFQSFAY